MSDIPLENPLYVALPVYEARIGQQVQSALIDAKWLPALREMRLHYWFIGDKRIGQPVLRRTVGAIDQHGRRKNINFTLHRVIATAIRLGEMPATLQALYDEVQATSSVRLGVNIGPHGFYDFRNENIMHSNRQHGRHARLINVRSNDTEITPQEIAIRQTVSDNELRREALAKLEMTEDQFALLAKPGDDLETLAARKAAEQENLADDIFAKMLRGNEQAEQAKKEGE